MNEKSLWTKVFTHKNPIRSSLSQLNNFNNYCTDQLYFITWRRGSQDMHACKLFNKMYTTAILWDLYCLANVASTCSPYFCEYVTCTANMHTGCANETSNTNRVQWIWKHQWWKYSNRAITSNNKESKLSKL